MLFWPLFFLLNLYAQETSVEEYCFPSSAEAKTHSLRMKAVLLPVDVLTLESNCFSIQTPSHRRELIQALVRRLEPSVTIKFSSAELKQGPCQLKVERYKDVKKEQTLLNNEQGISAANNESSGKAQETMSIQTLSSFELNYNQAVILGNCKYITPNRYEISLQVRKDPTPLYPGLPAGTPVVLTHPPKPVGEETSSLQTTLQLNRGERIEIGSMLKRDSKNDHTLSTPQNVEFEKIENQQQEKVFLSLE